MTTTPGTALLVLQDGQLCLTTDAIGILTGIHPDDITPSMFDGIIPNRFAIQKQKREDEATNLGFTDRPAQLKYWANHDHNADVHTDPHGQMWMTPRAGGPAGSPSADTLRT
jgi:hypothetical protein